MFVARAPDCTMHASETLVLFSSCLLLLGYGLCIAIPLLTLVLCVNAGGGVALVG